jgi:hypothetical protein
MIELQIHMRNKIEKLNCKHEMKRIFPTFLCDMFAFDSFLLEHETGVIVVPIVPIVPIACQPSESGWRKRECLQN